MASRATPRHTRLARRRLSLLARLGQLACSMRRLRGADGGLDRDPVRQSRLRFSVQAADELQMTKRFTAARLWWRSGITLRHLTKSMPTQPTQPESVCHANLTCAERTGRECVITFIRCSQRDPGNGLTPSLSIRPGFRVALPGLACARSPSSGDAPRISRARDSRP